MNCPKCKSKDNPPIRFCENCGHEFETFDQAEGNKKKMNIKEIKIKTPYGQKNWSFVKKCFDNHEPMIEALKYLTKEINLSKLNIRKDFSLINAHANANKVLFKIEGEK